MSKPILCLDFDGTCTTYEHGWEGYGIISDPPVDGLKEFLIAAMEHFDIQVYSSRSCNQDGRFAMMKWFEQNLGMDISFCIHFPVTKPPATISLDDRAITFTGKFPDVQTLVDFVPWNKTKIVVGEDHKQWEKENGRTSQASTRSPESTEQ